MKWKKNKPDQKLESTSGLTFIWPQENWMVNCNIGSCQYFANIPLNPPHAISQTPPPSPYDMQTLTFITDVLTVTSTPCRIVRCNSQEGDKMVRQQKRSYTKHTEYYSKKKRYNAHSRGTLLHNRNLRKLLKIIHYIALLTTISNPQYQ